MNSIASTIVPSTSGMRVVTTVTVTIGTTSVIGAWHSVPPAASWGVHRRGGGSVGVVGWAGLVTIGRLVVGPGGMDRVSSTTHTHTQCHVKI